MLSAQNYKAMTTGSGIAIADIEPIFTLLFFLGIYMGYRDKNIHRMLFWGFLFIGSLLRTLIYK